MPTLPDHGYPRIFYNINLPPVYIRTAAEAAALGSAWRPLETPVPEIPPVELEPSSADFNSSGGAGSFQVTITGFGASKTWTVITDASVDWVTIDSPTTPQYVDGPVNYTVADQPGSAPTRTTQIWVNGNAFSITQK